MSWLNGNKYINITLYKITKTVATFYYPKSKIFSPNQILVMPEGNRNLGKVLHKIIFYSRRNTHHEKEQRFF